MVSATGKPSLRAASCCSVDVVKGGAGVRRVGRVVMEAMLKRAPRHVSRKARASSLVLKRVPSSARSWAVPPSTGTSNVPATRQEASLLNAAISRSRSTMRRTATLWTRPAERPPRTLRQSTGESLKPTRRSSTRRACCASTRLRSMWRGCSMAARMAGFVISWNTMRRHCAASRPSTSARCHAMASPSRSSSEASHTASAFLACAFSSFTTLTLSADTSYCGSNVSKSTPKSFFFRSRMWPKLDMTL